LGSTVTPSARLDPTVWGDAVDGPLRPNQVEQFDRDGFLVVPGWIPGEEAAEWRRQAEALRGDTAQELVYEKDSRMVRTIFKVDRNAPYFARISRDRRLLGIATQLLGGPVYVHQSRINFKPALKGGDFWWHSDFEIWHTEDGMPVMRALSVSILLDATTSLNGPMLFVPGSHRTFVPCPREASAINYKQELQTQDYTAPDKDVLSRLITGNGIVQATGEPGALVVSDCNVMHGSAANMSPWPRSILFYCYNSVHNALAERPPLGTPPRPDYLAHRNYAPLTPADSPQ
jgi:ectoine hydroxylase